MADGQLFYVVGASGVGKDSLLQYARSRLAERDAVVFAHRYITRPAGAGGENHVALAEPEFLLRKRYGLFVMDWESHGLRYGIGTEINYWLAMGLSVVVNGSRGYLPTALRMYPDLTVVWITAEPELVAARLARRGRESARGIAARLEHSAGAPAPAAARVVHINNSGALAAAGEKLLALLARPR